MTRDAWVTGWVFEEHEANPRYSWPEERGSGYPSGILVLFFLFFFAMRLYLTFVLFSLKQNNNKDPKTQAWLRDSLEPTFGFPSLVRFSWATVKVALEKYGHAVKW